MKKLLIILTALVISLFLVSCSQQSEKQVENQQEQEAEYETVPLTRLLANPEDYHGKKVRVEGFATFLFEQCKLYVSREAVEYTTDECVWLEIDIAEGNELTWLINGEEVSDAQALEMSGNFFTVCGTFDMNYDGQGMLTFSTKTSNGAIIVDEIRPLQKYGNPTTELYHFYSASSFLPEEEVTNILKTPDQSVMSQEEYNEKMAICLECDKGVVRTLCSIAYEMEEKNWDNISWSATGRKVLEDLERAALILSDEEKSYHTYTISGSVGDQENPVCLYVIIAFADEEYYSRGGFIYKIHYADKDGNRVWNPPAQKIYNAFNVDMWQEFMAY